MWIIINKFLCLDPSRLSADVDVYEFVTGFECHKSRASADSVARTSVTYSEIY